MMESSARQVLTGGVVMTMNPEGAVFSPGVVVIEGARIVYAGPEGAWRTGAGDAVVDLRGHLVMPGLINSHTHTCTVLFRGLGQDRSREAWFASGYAVPEQARAQPDDYYWGTMLGGLEMLTSGITCTADRFSHMDIIAEAFARLGLRAVLCHSLADTGRPLEWDRAAALIDRWGCSPDDRIHCGVGPHAPDTCSDALLRRVRALANERGARIFIHCAQAEGEVAALRARGHGGAVRCLRACDLLGPDVVAAHCIYVDDDEIRILAETGTWVAHCPVSNARIEGRTASIPAMLRAGVRVSLGTDWAVTHDTMDLFDEMKCAGLLHKVAAGDPTAMSPDQLLRMATIDGARALGLGAHAGSLEPGKHADVIALAMDGPHLQPWRSVPETLVYAAKGSDIRHSWVDGRWVVRNRHVQGVDVGEVHEQVARIWRRLAGEA